MKIINNYNTTQLLECLPSTTLTAPSAAKEVEHQELSLIALGHATWNSIFGRHFGGFLQN